MRLHNQNTVRFAYVRLHNILICIKKSYKTPKADLVLGLRIINCFLNSCKSGFLTCLDGYASKKVVSVYFISLSVDISSTALTLKLTALKRLRKQIDFKTNSTNFSDSLNKTLLVVNVR